MNFASPFYVYIIIFIAKLVEVALATLRTVLNTRSQKLLAAFIGFFEIVIWLYVANAVLSDISSDPFKVVVYCLAFSFGNYIGVTIEEKLALGMSVVEVLANKQDADELASLLRERGYGVTTIESSGKDTKMIVLKLYLKRKQLTDVTEIIKNNCPKGLYSVSDVKNVTGGFIKK